MDERHAELDRTLDLEIVPRVSRFASDDPRSLDDVAELIDALRAVVTVHTAPVPVGTKGAGETVGSVLITLAGLNPIGALVEALKAWLSRDRGRRLDISWITPTGRKELHVSGTDLDPDAIRQWQEAARNQFLRDQ